MPSAAPRSPQVTLRRSSRGGGRNIVVPIALDDYVFAEWKPDRNDLALYIRDLVIAKFCGAFETDGALTEATGRLVEQLSLPSKSARSAIPMNDDDSSRLIKGPVAPG